MQGRAAQNMKREEPLWWILMVARVFSWLLLEAHRYLPKTNTLLNTFKSPQMPTEFP